MSLPAAPPGGESPLVLALDTGDLGQALAWSRAAGEAAGMVKVGLELFAAAGPAAVGALASDGRRVMLDLKLHDIPATVAGGMRAAARAGAELITVHALGGPAMLEAAVRAAGDRCRVAAVTGGLSGPAIRPVAVRCVWQVAQALPGVPIVGTGGVLTADDAAELLLVGATAVAVGTGNFINPRAVVEVADGLGRYLAAAGVASPAELPALFKAER